MKNLILFVSSLFIAIIFAASITDNDNASSISAPVFHSRNHCFGLFDDLFGEIVLCLDAASSLQLRTCNSSFLNGHICVTKNILKSHLQPKISSGYECLNDKPLAAFRLLPFLKDLRAIALSEKRSKTNRFDEFISLAVSIFFNDYKRLGWHLIIETLPSGLLTIDHVEVLIDGNYKREFHNSIIYESVPLQKFLIRLFHEHLDLENECLKCILSDRRKVFDVIIDSVRELNLMTESMFENLLVRSLGVYDFSYAEKLLETFPEFVGQTHPFIFCAVQYGNLPKLKLLLKYNSSEDIENLKNEYGMNLLEFVAQTNFIDGVTEISRKHQNPNVNLYINSVQIAFKFGYYATIRTFIAEIDLIWGFTSASQQNILNGFIINALDSKKTTIITWILRHWSLDRLSDDFDYSKSPATIDPIQHAIKIDYLDGLLCILKGAKINDLLYRDQFGRSLFLMAAHHGSVNVAFHYAAKYPNLIQSFDNDGNNALHLVIFNQKDPLPFIQRIAHLNVNWDHLNHNNRSPREIVSELSSIFTENK